MRFIDITGKKFGKLTVLYRLGNTQSNETVWHCLCECGNYTDVTGSCLRHGITKSCGCLRIEKNRELHSKHGGCSNGYKEPLYKKWESMKRRCSLNVNNRDYDGYAKRGIKVCELWNNSYLAFKDWALKNGYVENSTLQLDRINNDGIYEPSNCHWVTPRENSLNRRSNRKVLFRGKQLTIEEIANITNQPYSRVLARVNRGWKDEQLALPLKTRVK